MHMFQVSNYSVHPSSGIVDLEIKFDIGYGEKVDKRSYFEKSDADNYIYSCKMTYILLLFEKYVNHSQILNDTGTNKAFYKTQKRSDSLDKCQRAKRWFQEQDLISICKLVLRLEQDLQNILPSPGNPSFESSKNRMYDIVVFARNEVGKQLTISIKNEVKQEGIL